MVLAPVKGIEISLLYNLCMSGNSTNDKVDMRPFGKIFEIGNEKVLDDFLYGDGHGRININLVKTSEFYFKSLSEDALKMCQRGNNVGGNSQISEAFSYELFARWGYTEPDKVSRVWSSVINCNVFSWVTYLNTNLLLEPLLSY